MGPKFSLRREDFIVGNFKWRWGIRRHWSWIGKIQADWEVRGRHVLSRDSILGFVFYMGQTEIQEQKMKSLWW